MQKKIASVVVVVLVVAAAAAVLPVRAGLSAAACQAERHAGINACKTVLYGQLPTPLCCERVRVIHLECVCPVVTPNLAALIDVNRAIKLVEGCGRRVPRHFKYHYSLIV